MLALPSSVFGVCSMRSPPDTPSSELLTSRTLAAAAADKQGGLAGAVATQLGAGARVLYEDAWKTMHEGQVERVLGA